jgi:DNA-binding LacI/PurR family transcriptional regulator
VGVDDTPESSHFWPSLTTVHQPLREAGAMAVQDVDRRIRTDRQRSADRDPRDPTVTELQPRLVVRGSSRPVVGVPAAGGG